MLSKKQELEKQLNILKVANFILNFGGTIEEISKALNIPKSTVQRYLNDKDLNNYVGKKNADKIHLILENNKLEGLKKGGQNFVENNIPLKDENGNFIGSRKK